MHAYYETEHNYKAKFPNFKTRIGNWCGFFISKWNEFSRPDKTIQQLFKNIILFPFAFSGWFVQRRAAFRFWSGTSTVEVYFGVVDKNKFLVLLLFIYLYLFHRRIIICGNCNLFLSLFPTSLRSCLWRVLAAHFMWWPYFIKYCHTIVGFHFCGNSFHILINWYVLTVIKPYATSDTNANRAVR